MNILVLSNDDLGVYLFRYELLQRLLEEHKVGLSLPDGLKVRDLKEIGCVFHDTPIDRRGINPVRDLKLLLRYRKLLHREKPDLVITYTVKPNIYGGIACRLAKIPYAANITGLGTAFQGQGLLRKFVTFLYKTALRKAKVVFFENAANRQFFIDEGIICQEQSVLLSGAGVNLQRFELVPYPQQEPVRFLYLGRMMKEKGIDELFSVMERLRQEGVPCSLDALGYSEENYGDTIQHFEEQGWLRYHGYQSDVRPYIEQAHCFVLPSYHEGMANTNLECAAMGRPVITSNIPGCREAVIEGKTGLLCEPRDTDSLYAALRRFLEMTPEQRQAMGMAGRAHMEDVFDKKKVIEQTIRGLGL